MENTNKINSFVITKFMSDEQKQKWADYRGRSNEYE